jgi:hypothetical protein
VFSIEPASVHRELWRGSAHFRPFLDLRVNILSCHYRTLVFADRLGRDVGPFIGSAFGSKVGQSRQAAIADRIGVTRPSFSKPNYDRPTVPSELFGPTICLKALDALGPVLEPDLVAPRTRAVQQ